MGSEQSQSAAGASQAATSNTQRFNQQQRPVSSEAGRFQRGYTIAAPTSDSLNNSQLVDTSPPPLDSRPVSPPMSVCSDSDLPYISYTNNPIGGRNIFLARIEHFRVFLSLFRLTEASEQRPESDQGATSCEPPTTVNISWCTTQNHVGAEHFSRRKQRRIE